MLEQVCLWLVRERLTISTCFAGVISTSKGESRSHASLMSPRDTGTTETKKAEDETLLATSLRVESRVQSNLAIVKCINPTDPFTIAIISL